MSKKIDRKKEENLLLALAHCTVYVIRKRIAEKSLPKYKESIYYKLPHFVSANLTNSKIEQE
jgi:hypothetical protein